MHNSPLPACPLCDNASNVRRELKGAFLRRALSLCFDERVPDPIPIPDYRLLACPACTLEFAWPLEPGGASFYDWVTKQPNYYPGMRWEWGVLNKIMTADSRPIRLLEVGCGDGSFLESLKPFGHVEAVGLDTTKESVDKCRAKHLNVYAQPLEDYVRDSSATSQRFDFIVSFHCLEHLSDPKGIVMTMRELLAPGGSIFLSTPYSPLSYERTWFDPLNHPPHHMTRWNLKSFARLGSCIGLAPTFRMPRSASLSNRVAETLNLVLNGPQHMQGRRRLLKRAIKSPFKLTREIARQLLRERLDGTIAANVVLAEFSANEGGGSSVMRED
jgi:2-polyprenyl-3-methyl-5-hydroxy-6-metoxy-1,4-benzoquinol methylase